jgi:hypothetical protein
MNFGGSRLGFWFRSRTNPPSGTARSDTRGKNALIVYDVKASFAVIVRNQVVDPYPQKRAGFVNSMDTYSDELKTRLQSFGWNVTIVTSYPDFLNRPSNSNISQIWDLSFSAILPTNVATAYSNYVKSGGALYLMGEEPDHYNKRNFSMCQFIGNLGGGYVEPHYLGALYPPPSTMAQEFALIWNDSTVQQDYIAFFKNWGAVGSGRFSDTTGTKILYGPAGNDGFPYPDEREDRVYAAMWKKGSLADAPTGSVILVLDSTYFLFDSNPSDHRPNFIENMIFCLDYK